MTNSALGSQFWSKASHFHIFGSPAHKMICLLKKGVIVYCDGIYFVNLITFMVLNPVADDLLSFFKLIYSHVHCIQIIIMTININYNCGISSVLSGWKITELKYCKAVCLLGHPRRGGLYRSARPLSSVVVCRGHSLRIGMSG